MVTGRAVDSSSRPYVARGLATAVLCDWSSTGRDDMDPRGVTDEPVRTDRWLQGVADALLTTDSVRTREPSGGVHTDDGMRSEKARVLIGPAQLKWT